MLLLTLFTDNSHLYTQLLNQIFYFLFFADWISQEFIDTFVLHDDNLTLYSLMNSHRIIMPINIIGSVQSRLLHRMSNMYSLALSESIGGRWHSCKWTMEQQDLVPRLSCASTGNQRSSHTSCHVDISLA